jgi:multiple sugar transport system substrate-binding protein
VWACPPVKLKGNIMFKLSQKLFVALVLAVLLVSCSRKEDSNLKKIRWIVDPAPSRQDELNGFLQENPDIKVDMNNTMVGLNAILTQIAGNSPPDVFAIYTPAQLRIFMEKKALLDLKPYLAKYNIDENDFWPALKPYMYFDDKLYGLPPNCGPFVLFYNKDMFDQKKLKYPDGSWTWKELMEYGQKLTDINENTKEYKQFGLLCTEPMLFIWQNGGSLFSPDGKKCVVNSKEAKEAMRYYCELQFKYHITPKPQEMQNLAASGGWGGMLNLFAAKKVAMFVQGRWMSMVFRKDKTLKWNVAPVPRGKYKVTMLGSKVYAVPSNSKHPEEAVKFLVYQVSKKNQLIIAKGGDGNPGRISIGKSKEFLFDNDFPNEDRNYVYVDEMKYARAPEFSPYADATQVERVWTEETEKLYNDLLDTSKPIEYHVNNRLDIIADRINKLIVVK